MRHLNLQTLFRVPVLGLILAACATTADGCQVPAISSTEFDPESSVDDADFMRVVDAEQVVSLIKRFDYVPVSLEELKRLLAVQKSTPAVAVSRISQASYKGKFRDDSTFDGTLELVGNPSAARTPVLPLKTTTLQQLRLFIGDRELMTGTDPSGNPAAPLPRAAFPESITGSWKLEGTTQGTFTDFEVSLPVSAVSVMELTTPGNIRLESSNVIVAEVDPPHGIPPQTRLWQVFPGLNSDFTFRAIRQESPQAHSLETLAAVSGDVQLNADAISCDWRITHSIPATDASELRFRVPAESTIRSVGVGDEAEVAWRQIVVGSDRFVDVSLNKAALRLPVRVRAFVPARIGEKQPIPLLHAVNWHSNIMAAPASIVTSFGEVRVTTAAGVRLADLDLEGVRQTDVIVSPDGRETIALRPYLTEPRISLLVVAPEARLITQSMCTLDRDGRQLGIRQRLHVACSEGELFQLPLLVAPGCEVLQVRDVLNDQRLLFEFQPRSKGSAGNRNGYENVTESLVVHLPEPINASTTTVLDFDFRCSLDVLPQGVALPIAMPTIGTHLKQFIAANGLPSMRITATSPRRNSERLAGDIMRSIDRNALPNWVERVNGGAESSVISESNLSVLTASLPKFAGRVAARLDYRATLEGNRLIETTTVVPAENMTAGFGVVDILLPKQISDDVLEWNLNGEAITPTSVRDISMSGADFRSHRIVRRPEDAATESGQPRLVITTRRELLSQQEAAIPFFESAADITGRLSILETASSRIALIAANSQEESLATLVYPQIPAVFSIRSLSEQESNGGNRKPSPATLEVVSRVPPNASGPVEHQATFYMRNSPGQSLLHFQIPNGFAATSNNRSVLRNLFVNGNRLRPAFATDQSVLLVPLDPTMDSQTVKLSWESPAVVPGKSPISLTCPQPAELSVRHFEWRVSLPPGVEIENIPEELSLDSGSPRDQSLQNLLGPLSGLISTREAVRRSFEPGMMFRLDTAADSLAEVSDNSWTLTGGELPGLIQVSLRDIAHQRYTLWLIFWASLSLSVVVLRRPSQKLRSAWLILLGSAGLVVIGASGVNIFVGSSLFGLVSGALVATIVSLRPQQTGEHPTSAPAPAKGTRTAPAARLLICCFASVGVSFAVDGRLLQDSSASPAVTDTPPARNTGSPAVNGDEQPSENRDDSVAPPRLLIFRPGSDEDVLYYMFRAEHSRRTALLRRQSDNVPTDYLFHSAIVDFQSVSGQSANVRLEFEVLLNPVRDAATLAVPFLRSNPSECLVDGLPISPGTHEGMLTIPVRRFAEIDRGPLLRTVGADTAARSFSPDKDRLSGWERHSISLRLRPTGIALDDSQSRFSVRLPGLMPTTIRTGMQLPPNSRYVLEIDKNGGGELTSAAEDVEASVSGPNNVEGIRAREVAIRLRGMELNQNPPPPVRASVYSLVEVSPGSVDVRSRIQFANLDSDTRTLVLPVPSEFELVSVDLTPRLPFRRIRTGNAMEEQLRFPVPLPGSIDALCAYRVRDRDTSLQRTLPVSGFLPTAAGAPSTAVMAIVPAAGFLLRETSDDIRDARRRLSQEESALMPGPGVTADAFSFDSHEVGSAGIELAERKPFHEITLEQTALATADGIEWECQAEINTARTAAYRHRVRLGGGVQVSSVALRAGENDLLLRYHHIGNELMLICRQPVSGDSDLIIRGRIPWDENQRAQLPIVAFPENAEVFESFLSVSSESGISAEILDLAGATHLTLEPEPNSLGADPLKLQIVDDSKPVTLSRIPTAIVDLSLVYVLPADGTEASAGTRVIGLLESDDQKPRQVELQIGRLSVPADPPEMVGEPTPPGSQSYSEETGQLSLRLEGSARFTWSVPFSILPSSDHSISIPRTISPLRIKSVDVIRLAGTPIDVVVEGQPEFVDGLPPWCNPQVAETMGLAATQQWQSTSLPPDIEVFEVRSALASSAPPLEQRRAVIESTVSALNSQCRHGVSDLFLFQNSASDPLEVRVSPGFRILSVEGYSADQVQQTSALAFEIRQQSPLATVQIHWLADRDLENPNRTAVPRFHVGAVRPTQFIRVFANADQAVNPTAGCQSVTTAEYIEKRSSALVSAWNQTVGGMRNPDGIPLNDSLRSLLVRLTPDGARDIGPDISGTTAVDAESVLPSSGGFPSATPDSLRDSETLGVAGVSLFVQTADSGDRILMKRENIFRLANSWIPATMILVIAMCLFVNSKMVQAGESRKFAFQKPREFREPDKVPGASNLEMTASAPSSKTKLKTGASSSGFGVTEHSRAED